MSNMLLIEWLSSVITDQAQELETVIYDLYRQLDFNQWSSTQLNRIGKLVNCDRLGLSDFEYIIKIKAYAAAQNSSGRPNEVLTALKLITDGNNVSMLFLGLATIQLTTDGLLGSYLVANLKTFMESVIAAGIKIDSIVYAGDANSFGFGDIVGTAYPCKGFHDIPDTADGGKFVYIL